MFHFTQLLKVEFKIFIAVMLVALFNLILFANLTQVQQGLLADISNITSMIVVYGGYIIASLLLIMLRKGEWLKPIFIALLCFMTFHILMSLYLLITDPRIINDGKAILADALMIWTVSILVFSLWYWIIDRGGPINRFREDDETRYDLLFPQYQTHIPGWTKWKPSFLDYTFFSFFTSTGFSPADTLPLTKRAKFLMMVEAFISLVIIGMIASRAISLIQ